MTTEQSLMLANFVLAAIFMASFLIEDRRLTRHERFLKSDPALQARFDQWKLDQRNPRSQRPPTE